MPSAREYIEKHPLFPKFKDDNTRLLQYGEFLPDNYENLENFSNFLAAKKGDDSYGSQIRPIIARGFKGKSFTPAMYGSASQRYRLSQGSPFIDIKILDSISGIKKYIGTSLNMEAPAGYPVHLISSKYIKDVFTECGRSAGEINAWFSIDEKNSGGPTVIESAEKSEILFKKTGVVRTIESYNFPLSIPDATTTIMSNLVLTISSNDKSIENIDDGIIIAILGKYRDGVIQLWSTTAEPKIIPKEVDIHTDEGGEPMGVNVDLFSLSENASTLSFHAPFSRKIALPFSRTYTSKPSFKEEVSLFENKRIRIEKTIQGAANHARASILRMPTFSRHIDGKSIIFESS